MSNYPAEEQPIPFMLSDYADSGIDLNRPEVSQSIDGSLGDKVIFENLMAVRTLLDIANVKAAVRGKPSEQINKLLSERYEGILHRRQQLGDIPPKDGIDLQK